ncbi:unnamed protein product, partial [Tetraodon nigroviridis]
WRLGEQQRGWRVLPRHAHLSAVPARLRELPGRHPLLGAGGLASQGQRAGAAGGLHGAHLRQHAGGLQTPPEPRVHHVLQAEHVQVHSAALGPDARLLHRLRHRHAENVQVRQLLTVEYVQNQPTRHVVTNVLLLSWPLQGAEGVPLAHGPAGALHVQPPPAEDPGSDADDGQLVLVRLDRGRSAEPRQEHPGLRHGHHVGRTGLYPVLRGPLGLHDGCG